MSILSSKAGMRLPRHWLFFACVIIVNIAVWILYIRMHRPPGLDLLRVEQFEPGDGSVEANSRPQFTWRFNLEIANRDSNLLPVRITPPLPGKFYWENQHTLHFTPTDPLPVATKWDLVLPREGITSVQGCRLANDDRRTTQTSALQWLSARQKNFADQTVLLELKFNDLVLPADLASRLRARDGAGKLLDVRVEGNKPSSSIAVQVDHIEPKTRDQQLLLEIAHGLSAHTGVLGMATDCQLVVDITTQLVLDRAQGTSGSDGSNVTLSFNGAVDCQNLQRVLSISPPVTGLRYHQAGESEIILDGSFQPATRYALKLASAPKSDDTSDYPRPETRTVFIPDVQPQLGFDSSEGYLGAAGSRTAYASAVNVPSVDVKIYRLYDNNLVPWGNDPEERSSVEEQGRLLTSRTLVLKNKKNVREEVALKLDELLPLEDRGDGIFEIQIAKTPQANAQRVLQLNRNDDDEETSSESLSSSMLLSLSDIGLSVKQGQGRQGGQGQIVASALSLANATPMESTRVRVFSSKNQLIGEGTTGSDGVVEIDLKTLPDDETPSIVVADRAADQTNSQQPTSTTWLHLKHSQLNLSSFATTGRPYLRQGYEAFVYKDRGVFRPGETARFRSIVRGPRGQTPPAFPVQWILIDPRGKCHSGGTLILDADGASAWDWKIPPNAPTGAWAVRVQLPNNDSLTNAAELGSTDVQIEDFMPDRLKVDLKLGDGVKNNAAGEPEIPHVAAKGALTAAIHAAYFFGQPGANLHADLTVIATPTVFAPHNWKGWIFSDEANVSGTAPVSSMKRQLPDIQLILNEKGDAQFPIDLTSLLSSDTTTDDAAADEKPASSKQYQGPWQILTETSVHDISGRAVSRDAQAFVDPGQDYIGLRPSAAAALPGVPTTFDLALVDPLGKVRPGKADLRVSLYRESWNNTLAKKDGHYYFQSVRVLTPADGTPAASLHVENGLATFQVTPSQAGSYVVCAQDAGGGPITSQSFEVLGNGWEDTVSEENPERLEVIVVPQNLACISQWVEQIQSLAPRLGSYAPSASAMLRQFQQTLSQASSQAHVFKSGEWVSVIVKSPFKGTLLLTVETDRVLQHKTVVMNGSAVSVPVQIDDLCHPNVYISASVIRRIDPKLVWMSHRAYGLAAIKVADSSRQLNVQVSAPAVTKPGNTLPVQVRVLGADGNPVAGAALTVAAVDEGILQLTGFATPSPVEFFAAKRSLGVNSHDVYGQLIPDGQRQEKNGDVGGDQEVPASRYKPPVGARRVKPVSLSSEVLHTDNQGLAEADFPLPQFNGQLRLMAIAYAGPAAGASQSATQVRAPLVVQASWPRFAAPGDRFSVPVTLFNTTQTDGRVKVSLDLQGPLQSAVSELPEILLPAGAQQTCTFEVTARQAIGVGQALVRATMNDQSTSDAVELPIRPASPNLTWGDCKVALPGTRVQAGVGPAVLAGTGSYRLRVASKPELILPRGLDYLNSYPYGCCEQTVSCLFPLVALKDLGHDIDPVLFNTDNLADKVNDGIARLVMMQKDNGGLSMWPGGSDSWAYGSIYAAHFITVAEASGYHVPQDYRDQLYNYLRSLLNDSNDDPDGVENQAYACYVLALANRPDRTAMERLSLALNRPPITPELQPTAPTRFMLAAAWMAIQHRTRAQELVPQVLPAPRSSRELSGNIGSPVTDRAMIISTLMMVEPDHPALPGLVEQLVELGRRGQWRSTQDTAFSLLALAQYERKTRDIKPFTQALLTRGVEQLASATRGQEINWKVDGSFFNPIVRQSDAIMQPVAAAAMQPVLDPAAPLTVTIEGPPQSRGFISWVQTGVPLATPPDERGKGIVVTRKFLALDSENEIDTSHLASGQLVRVQLTLQSSLKLDDVALEDMLPAGLEIENPRLVGSANLVRSISRHGRHRNFSRLHSDTDEASSESPGANADPNAKPNEPAIPAMSLDTDPDIRDDRIVLFTAIDNGTCRYEYLARAITVGTFTVPPVRAECMYDSATYSLTGAGTLTVVPDKARSTQVASQELGP